MKTFPAVITGTKSALYDVGFLNKEEAIREATKELCGELLPLLTYNEQYIFTLTTTCKQDIRFSEVGKASITIRIWKFSDEVFLSLKNKFIFYYILLAFFLGLFIATIILKGRYLWLIR